MNDSGTTLDITNVCDGVHLTKVTTRIQVEYGPRYRINGGWRTWWSAAYIPLHFLGWLAIYLPMSFALCHATRHCEPCAAEHCYMIRVGVNGHRLFSIRNPWHRT